LLGDWISVDNWGW